MSAITVIYRDGQDLHLTVYHPSLNRTQIMAVKALDQKSTSITTNAGLMVVLGTCFLGTGFLLETSSLLGMTIASILTLVGGAALYLLETRLWYWKRLQKTARSLFLEPDEISVSVTIPTTSKKVQERLFEVSRAIRDKQDNKKDVAALYQAVKDYTLGEPTLDTRPMSLLLDAI